MPSAITRQGRIHFIKPISIQVNIEVVGDIYVCVSQQAGENLHVNAFVIAIRGECVPEYVFSSVFNPRLLTGDAGLVSQGLVGKPFAVVIGENPFVFSALIQAFQQSYRLGREGHGSPAAFALHAVLNKGSLPVRQTDNRVPHIYALSGKLNVLPSQGQGFSNAQARFNHQGNRRIAVPLSAGQYTSQSGLFFVGICFNQAFRLRYIVAGGQANPNSGVCGDDMKGGGLFQRCGYNPHLFLDGG